MLCPNAFGHSISMHSGATNLGWVWNWSLAPTDDDSVLEALSERYLANTTQPSFYVTNGAAWYITHGDTNDWSYGIRGAPRIPYDQSFVSPWVMYQAAPLVT